MTPEKKLKFNYLKTEQVCSKCGRKVIVETDYLSDSQARGLHKCSKEKK